MLLMLSSRGGPLPPAVLAIAARAISHSRAHLAAAQGMLRTLLEKARQMEAELQLQLLRLTPADSAQAAFAALAGKEPPWDALLRDLLSLSEFASSCSTAMEESLLAQRPQSSDGGSGSTGDEAAVQLLTASSKKAHVALGGRLCLELVRGTRPPLSSSADGRVLAMPARRLTRAASAQVTRVCSMLAQLKLSTQEVYLNAVSLSLGLLIKHMEAVLDALAGQESRIQCAENVLNDAGVAPSPDPPHQAPRM